MEKNKTVEEYIANAPRESQERLRQVRKVIKETAPKAEERISYAMPYYGYLGRLLYIGGYKNYIGLYVMSEVRENLHNEIKKYQTSKSTLQFPHSEPLPLELIKKIVKTQAAANEISKGEK